MLAANQERFKSGKTSLIEALPTIYTSSSSATEVASGAARQSAPLAGGNGDGRGVAGGAVGGFSGEGTQAVPEPQHLGGSLDDMPPLFFQ